MPESFDDTTLNLNSAWGDMVNAANSMAEGVAAKKDGNMSMMRWHLQQAGGHAELAVKKINWILQFGGE